ncbi:MAG: SDR family oxidoreductase [Bdellovibrionota bacterium]
MPASQVMILTGCASGIARHVAEVLARDGHHLLLTDVNQQGLLGAAEEKGWSKNPEIALKKLDVRDPAAWEEAVASAVQKWGRLDVLLNIAGYLKPGFTHQVSAEEVDRHFDINVKGLIHGTRVAARQMVAQRAGHIVNIASMAGIAPIPGLSLYSGSKFAVRGFSLAAAQELRPHGVFVTTICPDAVQTPMLDLQRDYKEAAMTFSGPRALSVEEIADAILKALEEKPLEVRITPPRSGRAIAAQIVNAFPDLALRIGPLIQKQGLKRQKQGK